MTTNQVRVKISGRTVAFPSVCPHCLRPATVAIGIKSPEELVGFYVLFSQWKHSTIQVPFCAEFARRFRMVSKVCLISLFAFVATSIVVILTFGIALEGWQAGLSVGVVIAITWIPSFLDRPDKYIKLVASTGDSVDFIVNDAGYAGMLQRSNGTTPSPEKSTTKAKDDGQGFAA